MQKPKEKKETELKILNQYVHLLKDYHEQIGIKITNKNCIKSFRNYKKLKGVVILQFYY